MRNRVEVRQGAGLFVIGATTALMLTACGSSGPSMAAGEQTASSARAPVAQQYWKVIAAIEPYINTTGDTPGHGSFLACPGASGQPSQRVSYGITIFLESRDPRLDVAAGAGRFMTQLEQVLRAQGWGAFKPSPFEITSLDKGGAVRSARNGYYVYLQRGLGAGGGIPLAVGGPCVNVGTAFASAAPGLNDQIGGADEYPISQASAHPAPTRPLPSPSS